MALPAQRGREKSSDADFFLLQKKSVMDMVRNASLCKLLESDFRVILEKRTWLKFNQVLSSQWMLRFGVKFIKQPTFWCKSIFPQAYLHVL